MASGPVIRLRLAIIRLTLAPKQHDDALVIEHSAMCVCATYIVYPFACACCQESNRAHNVCNPQALPTGRSRYYITGEKLFKWSE